MGYNGTVIRPNEDELEIKSGGTLSVESGGIINVETGGIIKADGTQASHIADIANDANGTAIATAVNAILAALEGVGITATE